MFSLRLTNLREVFQCGSKCVQLREPQGSAVVSFENQNGIKIMNNNNYCITMIAMLL